MNRWHVYELLKQTFKTSGEVLTKETVESHFKGIDRNELTEGIAEFEVATRQKVSSMRVGA